ncbi:MAG: tRNA pseudouridine(55) synthase TruB [Pseudomonadota bacterium]
MARQRKRKGDPVHGWLNLDKPQDITSTQAVGRLKRLTNAQKVGHGGTLDPLAEGILPLAFGEATKTVQWAMDADKEYVFTIHWGRSTDSQDREGKVTSESSARPSRSAIEDALHHHIGDIEQVPPRFSAIKVNGERAYDLARDGERFELKSRPVTVHSASLVDMPNADFATLRVQCGKGFYVRALARDLAFDLGCDGHISYLRRTRVGVFSEANATSLEKLESLETAPAIIETLSPLETVLDDVPSVTVGIDAAQAIRQGRSIRLLPHILEAWRSDPRAKRDDRLALAMDGETALALGEIRAGSFNPSKVFQIGAPT